MPFSSEIVDHQASILAPTVDYLDPAIGRLDANAKVIGLTGRFVLEDNVAVDEVLTEPCIALLFQTFERRIVNVLLGCHLPFGTKHFCIDEVYESDAIVVSSAEARFTQNYFAARLQSTRIFGALSVLFNCSLQSSLRLDVIRS